MGDDAREGSRYNARRRYTETLPNKQSTYNHSAGHAKLAHPAVAVLEREQDLAEQPASVTLQAIGGKMG